MNVHLFIFEHDESLPWKIWSTVNLERTGVLFFYHFVYMKVNLDLERTNQLRESSPNSIFAAVNLDPIVMDKKWTDGESWPNDFVEKVNRGEDLRWVCSALSLSHSICKFVQFVFSIFPSLFSVHSNFYYCFWCTFLPSMLFILLFPHIKVVYTLFFFFK